MQFTPTKQDYAKVLRLFFMKRTSTRVSLIFLVLAFGLICYMVLSRGTSPDLFEIIWLLLPPIFVVYVLVLQPLRMADRAIHTEQLSATATWEISDKGVEISTHFGSNHLDWDGLMKLVTTKEYFLLLSKVNRNAFRFLPKRAFSSSEQQELFLSYVRIYLPVT